MAEDGTPVPGPNVGSGVVRHGRRQLGDIVEPAADRPSAPDRVSRRSMRVSHEAIYQALYIQGRGALRRELTACLRTGRALRVPRARRRGRGKVSL